VRLDRPAHHVGAVLEASGFHPGRTARDHLRVLAGRGAIPIARVDHVLAEVDLAGAARRRVGGFSLGMRQRLALAGALLFVYQPAAVVLPLTWLLLEFALVDHLPQALTPWLLPARPARRAPARRTRGCNSCWTRGAGAPTYPRWRSQSTAPAAGVSSPPVARGSVSAVPR
jgi:hypothetical protein